jgi:hypothetical protein
MDRKKLNRVLPVIGICLGLLLALSGAACAEKPAASSFEQGELIEVKVHLVGFDSANKQPLVFLSDFTGQRALPIVIGLFEASAIYAEMQGITHRRPLTHDLLERVLHASKETIHRVIITHNKEGIYYATIEMNRDDSLIEIDARPSDSIVMALKFDSPIYVAKNLFQEMAISVGEKHNLEELYGLTLQELTETLAEYFSFESTGGVLVSDVRKGGPAERSGIRRGDIVVKAAGKSVDTIASLRELLPAGTGPLQVKIFRKGQYLSMTLHGE